LKELKVCGREEVCIGFGGGNLKERDHFEEPGTDVRIILR
jgi:hypothetical protein